MSELKCTHSCSDCSRLGCRSASEEQYPPFCLTTNVDKALLEETLEIYRNDPEQGLIARTSACIEGEFYGRLTRVEETIEFIKRMGYKKIGIASCVGLMREASIFARILKAKGIEYFTVGCRPESLIQGLSSSGLGMAWALGKTFHRTSGNRYRRC